jgi:hypothetical protein
MPPPVARAAEPVQLPTEMMTSWILTRADVTDTRAAKHRLVEQVRG